MTMSSTNELYKPYKDPEREFRSSKKHFKSLSLDELRSPDFNLLFDKEYSEEEEEAMAKTMEQYMSKTQTDYGSGELRENTFSGSDNEDANEHIEEVLEIVELFHVPNITVDQLMLRVFPISLTGAASRWLRNEPTSSIKTWEDLKTKMTKVIKREFEKIKDVKVEDVSLTCDTSLEIFNMEVSRLSRIDNDLFTYKVEVANIPCNSVMDDDLEDETDDDMGYDPSDVAFIEWLRSKIFNYKTMDQYTMKALWIYWIRGDDEVELTDEESFDDEDEIAEVFRIDTNKFNYETPICSALNEFNYLLKVDPDLLTKDIMGFKTYDDYKNDWIYEWNKDKEDGYCNGGNLPGTYIIENQLHYQYYEWYEALDDCELKEEALRNKAIMDGIINDDESCCELKRKWNIYTNYDDAYEINHEDNGNKELCEIYEPSVCNIRKYMMIKYSFNDDKEYVAVKEDEYDDLIMTRRDTCQAYQEIFRIMDEGWMVTRAT
ncbi:hypothetical protein Tco_0606535 [Tanacetum coccineum]